MRCVLWDMMLPMRYCLQSTGEFDNWVDGLDGALKGRLAGRIHQIEEGNFGDHKAIGANLFELRCFFGGGLRVYYTLRAQCVVFLLAGGNKSSQRADIRRARELAGSFDGGTND